MLNKTGIYKIVNKVNGKVYYGSTTQTFCRRWDQHKRLLNNNKHSNQFLQWSWNKNGPSSFEFIIILSCSPNSCLYYEQLFLDKYWDNCKNCFNFYKTAGSPFGIKRSEESKKRNSISITGKNNHFFGKKHSEVSKKKISEANRGKRYTEERKQQLSVKSIGLNNPFYGKKHTEVSKKKISLAHQKEGNSFHNKRHSEESKLKMSIAQRGSKNHSYGKPVSNETKLKISQSSKGKPRFYRRSLTLEQVAEIRYLLSDHTTHAEIAKKFKVSKATIENIKYGKCYKL